MREGLQFYIDGAWVDPAEPRTHEVVNPATEEPVGRVSLGGAADVDRAVTAARRAFEGFSRTSPAERLALLEEVLRVYKTRYDDIARTVSLEMGAPYALSKAAQAAMGLVHLGQMIEAMRRFPFEETRGTTLIRREPVGVCALITPWNWPLNQIMHKVAPALAAGCTMVLKPSEVAPLNALIVAEVLHEAGVPAGVFNLVNGDGAGVGQRLASHPEVDMVSFTGSTRAGVLVAMAAAPSVKRVTQELGGKSANLILDGADLSASVAAGVHGCYLNSGQSCNAPSRMLVSARLRDEAVAIARATAEEVRVGDPFDESTMLGPVASRAQFEKVQGLIARGVEEGATLVTGGVGRPAGLERGFYVKPTVFADVTNDMTIAREEIFGPVLSIMTWRDEEDAIRIANDTPYGLSGYVSAGDIAHARRVAARLRTGNVHLNGAGPDFSAPFGGYKQSGNGREGGEFGLAEFVEVKAIFGAA